MRRVVSLIAVVVAVGLCCSGQALAAGTFTLCSTGPGKPVVSPGKSGKCASGEGKMVLASGSQVSSLNSQVSMLKRQVASLQATLVGVSRVGNTLLFSHMNLQIESGSGATNGAVNALGNLIIGYNERPGAQTGSHNLVLGDGQSFTSYGGIIGGDDNALSGANSDVFGSHNTASGGASSVTGGTGNSAGGLGASVTGGQFGTASGAFSSVTGGTGNSASGGASSVTGGESNLAGEGDSAVLAGCANATGSTAAADPGCGGFGHTFDSIAGGYDNLASGGLGSFVTGGNHNTAAGINSLVAGGFQGTAASGAANTLSLFGGGLETNNSSANNAPQVGNTRFSP